MIIGRLFKPDSERATHLWMKNQTALSELMDCDLNKISLNKVYDISDKLLLKKGEIESHLAATEDDFFSWTIRLHFLISPIPILRRNRRSKNESP